MAMVNDSSCLRKSLIHNSLGRGHEATGQNADANIVIFSETGAISVEFF